MQMREGAAIQAYNRLRSAGLTSSRSTTDFTDGNGKKMMATTYVLSGETSAAKLVEHAQALRNSFPDLFTEKDLAAVKAIRARFNTDKTVQDILQNKPFISITFTTVQPVPPNGRREPGFSGTFRVRSPEPQFTVGGNVGYSPHGGFSGGLSGSYSWGRR